MFIHVKSCWIIQSMIALNACGLKAKSSSWFFPRTNDGQLLTNANEVCLNYSRSVNEINKKNILSEFERNFAHEIDDDLDDESFWESKTCDSRELTFGSLLSDHDYLSWIYPWRWMMLPDLWIFIQVEISLWLKWNFRGSKTSLHFAQPFWSPKVLFDYLHSFTSHFASRTLLRVSDW